MWFFSSTSKIWLSFTIAALTSIFGVWKPVSLQNKSFIFGTGVDDIKFIILATKKGVIRELGRISRPGLRSYTKSTDIPKIANGLGIAIITTSKGLMVDREARKANLGGEVLAYIW